MTSLRIFLFLLFASFNMQGHSGIILDMISDEIDRAELSEGVSIYDDEFSDTFQKSKEYYLYPKEVVIKEFHADGRPGRNVRALYDNFVKSVDIDKDSETYGRLYFFEKVNGVWTKMNSFSTFTEEIYKGNKCLVHQSTSTRTYTNDTPFQVTYFPPRP